MSKKRASRDLTTILKGASDGFWKANPGIARELAPSNPIAQQGGKHALGNEGKVAQAVDKTSCRFHAVITRRGKRKLDYDNLVGGSKQLRDALSEDILKLHGDAPEDGITFEYAQVVTKETTDTLIEIYREG